MKKGEPEVSIEKGGDLFNIARVFENAEIAIKEGDWMKLKDLSNQTLHSATVHQDPLNIMTAVLVYSLSKIFQRKHYREMEGWQEFNDKLIKNWEEAILALTMDDGEKAIAILGKIRQSLNEISGNLALYLKDIFRKAEINKAFKLYENGLTAESTADLFGVSLWDLSSYIGQSSISEAHVAQSLPEAERIKYAEDFFK